MTLLEQIKNDRLGLEPTGHGMNLEREAGYRAGWNACSRHIEGLVRVHIGLAELREAKPMDMRLRDALVGGES